MKAYIGIDPGIKGVISVISAPDVITLYHLSDLDLYSLADLFYAIASDHPDRFAVIEDVRALHGSSSTATFSFGQNKGQLLALLCATRTPFEQVLPQRWQKAVWTPSDMVWLPANDASSRRRVDTKRTSINAARRLFPAVDLCRTPKCTRPDDNRADSLLLAAYAKRIAV